MEITRRSLLKTAAAGTAVAALATAPAIADEAPVVKMLPGKYTGYEKGHWQIWDLPVTITVNETSILKIEVPDDRFAHGETEILLDSVKEDMFPRIIENQSLLVDTTTGATETSGAVLSAIGKALAEALAAGGSDPSAIKAFYKDVVKPEPSEPIEKDVDILVVGLGDGGIFAMKSACETIQQMNPPMNAQGLVSILGIDRAGRFGGKSTLTHEGCCNNPEHYSQIVNGGEPLVDVDFFRNAWDTFVTTDGVYKAKRDVLDMWFEESGKTCDWLYENGFIWGTTAKNDPMMGGKIKYNVCIASNVDTGTYEDRRKWRRRYERQFIAEVESQGGEYMLNTEGYDFIMDGDRVAGVKARDLHTGQEYLIHAKAVIMNTGGYASNQEMLDTLLDPKYQGTRKTLGTSQDTGAMFQAALNIGAGGYNLEMCPITMDFSTDHWIHEFPINSYDNVLDGRTGRYKVWTLNNIPQGVGSLKDCIKVNKYGKRFLDEATASGFAQTIDQDSFAYYKGGSFHWSVVSGDNLEVIANEGFVTIDRWNGYLCQGDIPKGLAVPEVYQGLDVAVEEELAVKADTIEELAVAMGVDPATFVETVNTYNAYCEAGVDEEFGKDAAWLHALTKPPYYAVLMRAYSMGTEGGLDVDNQIRVLKQDGVTPIDGLYACGLDSMGVILNPDGGYPGFAGVAQGWLWTSGRIAGINAAKYVGEKFGFSYVPFALSDVKAVSDSANKREQ